MRIRHLAAALAATIAMTGRGGAESERNDSSLTGAERDAEFASEWTEGIIDRPRSNTSAATLVAVRTGTHESFDRIVFEFDERVPGYHVEYIDRPVRKCGSGKVAQVAGNGWLEVRLSPANAHTEEGRPTVAERERMPNLPEFLELELTCDFEAVVTWVLGVGSPNRYQVRELSSPPRLVVDVRR